MVLNNKLLQSIWDLKLTFKEFIYLYITYMGLDWDTECVRLNRNIPPVDYLKSIGYLDNQGNITQVGADKIQQLLSAASGKEITNTNSTYFTRWWDLYPLDDSHSIFPMSRQLKSNEGECRLLFNEIVAKGQDPEKMIRALEREVETRKQRSLVNNELTYMKNSEKYLREGHYLAWLNQVENESINPFNTYGKEVN